MRDILSIHSLSYGFLVTFEDGSQAALTTKQEVFDFLTDPEGVFGKEYTFKKNYAKTIKVYFAGSDHLNNDKKITTIRVIREISGLGLKEAKDVSEKPGSTLILQVTCSSADEMNNIENKIKNLNDYLFNENACLGNTHLLVIEKV
jgi:hypothetical protein